MPRFLAARVVHPDSGHIYELELGTEELMDLQHKLAVQITVRRIAPDEKPQEIGATLTLDLERRVIVVEIGGEEVGEISLDADGIVEADDADVEGADVDFGAAWDAVRSNIRPAGGGMIADSVEEILDSLPGFDPLTCLLKGAVSAVVPQIIRCYRQLPQNTDGAWDRVQRVGRCLREYGWRMLGRASWRAFRCMIKGA